MKNIHKGQYQEYMAMVLQGAKELGVQVDKTELEALDMDSPVGVGRVQGLDKFVDKFIIIECNYNHKGEVKKPVFPFPEEGVQIRTNDLAPS